jgi:hypothetical protein
MAELIQEVTDDGIQLSRELLEQYGYERGRKMVIAPIEGGLMIRAAEVSADDAIDCALQHLLENVGDMAAVRQPERYAGGWKLPVVLRPDLRPLGELFISTNGDLLPESTTVEAMIAAADAP